MSKDKINPKSGENQEETNNPRREFMGKAAIFAASMAVGSLAGGKQLLGKGKSVALNEGLVMLKDGKVYNGAGLMDHLGLDVPARGCNDFCIIKLSCRKLKVDIPLSIAKSITVNVGDGRTKQITRCDALIYPSSKSVIQSLKKRGLIADKKDEIKNIRRGTKSIRKGR